MSDSIEELSKQYMENVWERHSRSIGLFPIPEYPEFEAERGMWSTALDVLLTTLRYIAPATLLTIFWGQQSFLFKLLKYIDSAVRSLIFSNEEQKQSVLQWLADAGPVRVDKLDVVWRQGWIVCGVLDSALPGACAGHPPTKLSLKHAQTIADNYLGVEPAFSRHELESNDCLSRHQEWKLINYLEKIRLSLSKLTPPTPKSTNLPVQKATADVTHFTLDYVARGSGLVAAQIKNKVYFKIYPTAQQSLDPGEINILIHGPKDTYGIAVIPAILGKAQIIRQNLLGLQTKQSYTENALPITQGTTYLRSYGNNNINKTFYIPKTKYDIDIEIELKPDHAKIGYFANIEGKYEISITSRGQNVVGSPFTVTASNNIIGNLERDSFCLEDGEEIDIVDVKTDRKVVLRIVDFVTEKMLLNENGTFEKISEEQARHLMETDNAKFSTVESGRRKNKKSKSETKLNKFFCIANKVLILNRVCKIFRNARSNKPLVRKKHKHVDTKQDIPDILNTTIYDLHSPEKRNRIIIPENISVSLLTEKPKTFVEEKKFIDTSKFSLHEHRDNLVNVNILKVEPYEDDTISVDTVQSSNNPFVNDMHDPNYQIDKGLGSFFANEYETHNSQNEETENLTTKLLINSDLEISNENINPFLDVIELERPKTPVYKIISGEVTNRDDSVYIDPVQTFMTDENPFLKHETEVTSLYQEKPDFIIGAPVSLPPVNFVPSNTSAKTNMELITKTEKKTKNNKEKETITNNRLSTKGSSVETADRTDEQSFSSIDSNLTQDIIIIPRSSVTPTTISQSQSSRDMSPKKDTWDSAYVSIDDNNCISENNISEHITETINKRKSPLSEEFSKMGPAEREIWQNDSELKDATYVDEDYRFYKCDLKRPEFTPIIEENERNITSDMKEDTNKTDTGSVAGTFAELSDIYDNHYTYSENNSVTTIQDNKLQNLGIDYTLERNDVRVDSASEILTDVKRQAKKFEGEISEVQANATESFSVSQSLHVKSNEYEKENSNDEILFGDRIYSNIVLEKKKYWDDKIRQIEAKSEEIRLLQNKRKSTSKLMKRNDSISKKKGKKIVQNLLRSGQDNYDIVYTKTVSSDLPNTKDYLENMKSQQSSDNMSSELSEYDFVTCIRRNAAKYQNEPLRETLETGKLPDVHIIDSKKQISDSALQLKQELSEKVFQAFETSPKRFFGTSRKHILSKIDTFSESPEHDKEMRKTTSDVNHESGLVSSRILLFHSISQTEELPWSRRKCKSMHNISYSQGNEKNTPLDKMEMGPKGLVQDYNKIDNENVAFNETSTLRMNNRIYETPTPLKEKRARLTHNINNRSFDESFSSKHNNFDYSSNYVKRTIQGFNKQSSSQFQSSTCKLKSLSKSEMDIFNKVTATTIDDDLDKHKSYEELPRISVKNFISLYEDVSKLSDISPKKTKSIMSSNNQVPSPIQGTTSKFTSNAEGPVPQPSLTRTKSENTESQPQKQKTLPDDILRNTTNQSTNSSLDFEIISNQDKEANYLSLSDIDIEIIENDSERQESSPERETAHLEYKNRFTKAKKFFQSLEELRDEKSVKKFGTIDYLENSSSTESLENSKRPRKRNNVKKSNSMPSSEISKAWNQMHEQKEEIKKLVKISEKFNVDDLFEDVMEGRLSRQGSLRGIPHKKAVLETFRSMENITDCNLNSYEIAESQLSDFAKGNQTRNAQTYLSEYPYLPMTDPSKYHSRLDANATGLITFKELKKIPRRNSVPDLRLNPSFTADL